ncbi:MULTISPECIES: hypothetical protein [Clostridium]|uniref:Uncharacterized protein n=1 Tax=Clostridium cibarium TaxID=2762247 RepID=A0ABR8PUV6_9CLOT|nr:MULTISPECIES: hypothetical protein [Clostridium]MBD7911918.1 hypothetical protein [Clostridium cibarium]
MNKEFQEYTKKVLKYIGIDGEESGRINEDIYTSLIEKQQETGEDDPYKLMGDPVEVAKEFRENLGIESEEFIYNSSGKYEYEYKSKRKIFGIPLVHIIKNRSSFGVAKGIIAFGPISIGVISMGVVSVGALSFGALSLGLLIGIGGCSISGILSVGGLALSGFASIGGFAAAKYFAFGGYAMADIAIGGVTKGIVGVYNQSASGTYLFKSPAKINEVMYAVKEVHPAIGNLFSKVMEFFCSII